MLVLNSSTYYSSPVQVPGTTWRSITITNNNGMATKTDGTLWIWGHNSNGQLGQNQATPVKISSPTQIPGSWTDSVSHQGTFFMAINTDGELWGCGSNSKGPLGQNNLTKYSSPVQIPGTNWKDVVAGGESTIYALRSS